MSTNVGSVGSHAQTYNVHASQQLRQTGQVQSRDGDADDRPKPPAQAAKPSVNLNGETVGQLLNVSA